MGQESLGQAGFEASRGALRPSSVCSTSLPDTGGGQVARFPVSPEGWGERASRPCRSPAGSLRERCRSMFSCTEETACSAFAGSFDVECGTQTCGFVSGRQDFNDFKHADEFWSSR